ncbi:reverse transcriptase domain-containing protein [Tanacetum coccineum]
MGESTTTISSQLSLQQSQDKGKGILIEPMKPMKKKDLFRLDEEATLKLQAKFDEEERLAREKPKKEKEANISLIETWDDIQAKIDTDHQLAERLQAQEQKELAEEKKQTTNKSSTEKDNVLLTKETWKDYMLKDNAKKQKVEDNKEIADLKQCLEIIPDEEEVTIDAIPLAIKSPTKVNAASETMLGVTTASEYQVNAARDKIKKELTKNGNDEDEWIHVKNVRGRSVPLEHSECNRVMGGDNVLCFHEKSDQARYYDAQVIDIQRKLHDIRGCRCIFLVQYEHDKTERWLPGATFYGDNELYMHMYRAKKEKEEADLCEGADRDYTYEEVKASTEFDYNERMSFLSGVYVFMDYELGWILHALNKWFDVLKRRANVLGHQNDLKAHAEKRSKSLKQRADAMGWADAFEAWPMH